jgi:hypothetical protein
MKCQSKAGTDTEGEHYRTAIQYDEQKNRQQDKT